MKCSWRCTIKAKRIRGERSTSTRSRDLSLIKSLVGFPEAGSLIYVLGSTVFTLAEQETDGDDGVEACGLQEGDATGVASLRREKEAQHLLQPSRGN